MGCKALSSALCEAAMKAFELSGGGFSSRGMPTRTRPQVQAHHGLRYAESQAGLLEACAALRASIRKHVCLRDRRLRPSRAGADPFSVEDLLYTQILS